MKKLLAGLVLLFAAGLAGAGELGVYACLVDDDSVTHYRILADGETVATWAFQELQSGPLLDCDSDGQVDDPTAGGLLLGVPDNCTARTYTARSAVEEVAGACLLPEGDPGAVACILSTDSPSIVSIARPSVSALLVEVDGIRQVIGENFTAATTVTKADGTPIPSSWLSCQVLGLTGASAIRTIVVHVPGLTPFVFSIPLEAPSGLVVH